MNEIREMSETAKNYISLIKIMIDRDDKETASQLLHNLFKEIQGIYEMTFEMEV